MQEVWSGWVHKGAQEAWVGKGADWEECMGVQTRYEGSAVRIGEDLFQVTCNFPCPTDYPERLQEELNVIAGCCNQLQL